MQIQSGLVLHQTRALSMTRDMRRAIDLLRFNNAELAAYLAREAQRNPLIELRPQLSPPNDPSRPAPEARVAPSPGPSPGSSPGPAARGAGPAGPDTLPSAPVGLVDHVMAQIRLSIRDPEQFRIALVFVEALEAWGWLRHDLDHLVARAACTRAQGEDVLALLQECEPAGLFARSLGECLRLQAQAQAQLEEGEQGNLDPTLSVILDRLDLVADGDIGALALACGCSPDEAAAGVRRLRGFDPKPGLAFDGPSLPIRPPDLIARRGADCWSLELNGATLPSLVVREDAIAAREEERDRLVAEALANARGLMRAVEYRNANTLSLGAEILRQQAAFLEGDAPHPAPMAMKDVAGALGLHTSTVSRVVAGLTMQAPRGVVALRELFGRVLPTRGDTPGVAVAQVKDRIGALIAGEPPDVPLTDTRITEILDSEGIEIKRRTVAKYRAALGHAGAAERRRPRNRFGAGTPA